MAENRNSETAGEARVALGLLSSIDKPPVPIPVVECNPKMLRYADVMAFAQCFNATATTLYTVPTGKTLYITSASLSLIKDVTATSVLSAIQCVPAGGITTRLLCLAGFSTTVQTDSISLNFSTPIKLEPGGIVQVTNGTAVANCNAHGMIQGFLVDTIGGLS